MKEREGEMKTENWRILLIVRAMIPIEERRCWNPRMYTCKVVAPSSDHIYNHQYRASFVLQEEKGPHAKS